MYTARFGHASSYRELYQWVTQNAPDWILEDLPVVPISGYLQTGAEVRKSIEC